jgi:hypothetical protein
MRRMSAAVMTAVGLVAIAAATTSTPAHAETDAELRDLVTRHVQPLLLPPGAWPSRSPSTAVPCSSISEWPILPASRR